MRLPTADYDSASTYIFMINCSFKQVYPFLSQFGFMLFLARTPTMSQCQCSCGMVRINFFFFFPCQCYNLYTTLSFFLWFNTCTGLLSTQTCGMYFSTEWEKAGCSKQTSCLLSIIQGSWPLQAHISTNTVSLLWISHDSMCAIFRCCITFNTWTEICLFYLKALQSKSWL